MQIRLTFDSDAPILLPIHYNEYVQALIYRHLDEELARFLHDHGFTYGKRRFKLFTFSRIFGKYRLRRGEGLIAFTPPVRLYVGFSKEELARSFIRNVAGRKVVLEGNSLTVAEAMILNHRIGEYAVLKTLSPITVYRTLKEKGRRYTRYLSPKDSDFLSLIRANLLKKYELVYGEPYDGDFNLRILKGGREVIIKYKGTIIKAYDATLSLRGSSELLSVALGCGLGAKNSQGFGMVIPKSVRKISP
ncbi:MAG: CRISPR-associated endoribonuclease Cas6 [Thermotogae bacterium]|nr:CRISPR-associated endoribonuclease Cas6 [Thermotogota bacterium]